MVAVRRSTRDAWWTGLYKALFNAIYHERAGNADLQQQWANIAEAYEKLHPIAFESDVDALYVQSCNLERLEPPIDLMIAKSAQADLNEIIYGMADPHEDIELANATARERLAFFEEAK